MPTNTGFKNGIHVNGHNSFGEAFCTNLVVTDTCTCSTHVTVIVCRPDKRPGGGGGGGVVW